MAGPGIHPYHQPWAPQPPPPIPVENPSRASMDEVRTVFITGLPTDVKERELQNLLRWLPGYEASQINLKGEQPMGFALFSSPQAAMAARDALQNMVFDAESKSVLHTEMAKKNLFVKRGVVADSSSFDQSKRLRTGGDYTHAGYGSPAPFHAHPPPGPVWGPPGYMAPPPPPPYDPYGGYPVQQLPLPAPAPVPAPSGYAPVQNMKDNPPCNTLFIGNLGRTSQPGYKQMKILRQERNTVCFIEFEDVNSATVVHQNLQGAVLPSSGRGGMRIQYPFICPFFLLNIKFPNFACFFFLTIETFSKNPFGKRKDSVNGPGPEVNGAPY
ncbi:unnamed protein product [Spirodela intermedia]|uniref:RRM domain-containing protein n=1 Tax=Spirodela intermedia TaxID=51605 RepID=A0A7I8JPX5_SPIIN|nr:unnamed protein product [Spirodela intermedia]CAA6672214.1 unnamed protein product [Spirodela intermedia]